MESLKNYTNKAGEILKKYFVTAGLAGVLLSGTTSCGESTPQDINEQRQRIEMIRLQILSYRNSREKEVNKYNRLLNVPQTESNKYSIERVKAKLHNEILYYDQKIEDLACEKIEAAKYLGDMESEYAEVDSNNEPLDPNKYDYLLDL